MGRWYCSRKRVVEECEELSISRLREWGYLRGQCSGVLNWTWERSGRSNHAGIFTDVTGSPYARMNYQITRRDGQQETYDYRIALAKTPCHFGGERFWFVCPCCGRRAGKLFLGNRDGRFLCRTCQNLSYESRNESRMGRPGGIGYIFVVERKIEKLSAKIKRWTWRGRPTRKAQQMERLEQKANSDTYSPQWMLGKGFKAV